MFVQTFQTIVDDWVKYCVDRNLIAMEPSSSADVETETFTVSNTGPGDTDGVEIVVHLVKNWLD